MTIARVCVRAFALPLIRPLRTAFGEIARRSGWLVEIEDERGTRGFGEALPLPAFGGEGPAECAEALAAAAPLLLGDAARDGRLPAGAERATARAPVARAALETAALDGLARRRSCPLSRVLGGESEPESLPVNLLLAERTPAGLEREVAAAVAAGYQTLKLKVGAQALAADIACVGAVRRAAPQPVRIRLDANGAWSESEALPALRELSQLAVEWIEQPIAPGDPAALARLRVEGGLKIAADESASSPSAVRALLAADAIDALVIKLPTLGGPARAREVARTAQESGVRVVVSSFLDSTLGIAAAAQLAASLPQPLPACGLATAAWLADDLAEPWRLAGGRLWLPRSAGLGVDPVDERLGRLVGKTLVEAAV
ncbi:MAG: o-succinylbenzoate synthase [Myxococcota bacterium]|nr:o-succinylbenzoate synthase [Myxococcota bacterium]